MQFSSLPFNSSLQNNPRYQFSLKSENIEILSILSAAILKMAAIRSRFYFGQNILPTLSSIWAQLSYHLRWIGPLRMTVLVEIQGDPMG
jgi:hypothetical protein